MTPELWNQELIQKLSPFLGQPITQQLLSQIDQVVYEHRMSFFHRFGVHYLPLPILNRQTLTIEGVAPESLRPLGTHPNMARPFLP